MVWGSGFGFTGSGRSALRVSCFVGGLTVLIGPIGCLWLLVFRWFLGLRVCIEGCGSSPRLSS